MEMGWIFPFKEIKKDANVILYGAGKMGTCFYHQLVDSCYCTLKLWVDKNYKSFQKKGIDVQSPEIIKDLDFDTIIIAINSRKTVKDVMKYLQGKEINQNKIWHPFLDDNGMSEIVDENSDDLDKEKEGKLDVTKLDIAFVVPNPINGGGGHRNIFRAVKYLNDFGHKVTVYCTNTDDSSAKVKDNVSDWFYDMGSIEFRIYKGKIGYHDAAVATWWETAYIIQKEKYKFKEIFYFVQDFEPYFYPISSDYFFAESTYRLGFSHICSGPWCEAILKEKYKAEAVSFQFPLDTHIYNRSYLREKKEKNILFFAKPQMPRRCFELGVKALYEFKKKMPDVEIIMYGSNQLYDSMIPFPVTILNIVPTLQGLAELYANADLGIVFSTTNPSLVPFEMMSCGCPVVDLDLDFALTKYGNSKDNVFLLSPQPEIFAEQLVEIMENAEERMKKREHSMEWVKGEFPTEIEMAKFVERSIVNKFVKGRM